MNNTLEISNNMFDEYTNKILMEALNEDAAPRLPPVGMNRSYRRTAPKATQYKRQTSVPQYLTRTPREKSPGMWYGTDTSKPTELGAMYMPGPDAYADPRTQVAYGKYKQMVDPMVDYAFGMFGGIPGQIIGQGANQFTKNAIDRITQRQTQISSKNKMFGDIIQNFAPAFASKLVNAAIQNPVTMYATKQMVKADLANQYLGAGPMSDDNFDRISMELGLNDSEAEVAKTYADMVKKQIPVIGNTEDSAISNALSAAEIRIGAPSFPSSSTTSKPKVQDPIMKALSDKIPDLVKMGIDPLDWTTKLLGADEAAASMENMPNRARSVKSAGGYLIPGQQKGIY